MKDNDKSIHFYPLLVKMKGVFFRSTLLYRVYITLLLVFDYTVYKSFCLDKRFTINVEASKEDCFFQRLEVNDKLQTEYQVIDGRHGDLDISFYLVEPHGRIIVADFKKSEKSHSLDITVSGDYKFCFDNTFSSFNTKTVYFEVSVYNDQEDKWNYSPDIDFEKSKTAVEIQQIEGVNEVMNSVKDHLNKARILQDMIKLAEAKDRNIAEETYFKVNIYSLFVLVVMIFVTFIQIVMVKSIFDDKSKINKLLCFFGDKK